MEFFNEKFTFQKEVKMFFKENDKKIFLTISAFLFFGIISLPFKCIGNFFLELAGCGCGFLLRKKILKFSINF